MRAADADSGWLVLMSKLLDTAVVEDWEASGLCVGSGVACFGDGVDFGLAEAGCVGCPVSVECGERGERISARAGVWAGGRRVQRVR